jgi:endonuclease/exonuclease/phosphatase family metal-dependent hydrolase
MTSNSEVILASMNVHGGRGADGVPFDLAGACSPLSADIIAVQECWCARDGPDPLSEIADELGGELLRADLHADIDLRSLGIAEEAVRGRWGLAIVTTLPLIECEEISLGRLLGDLTPRAAQLVTLKVPGGRLRVANTHLTHRFASPLQLMRLVRHLLVGSTPTVIAGDLNMPGPVTGLAVGYRQAVFGRTFPAHWPLLQLDHVLTDRRVAFRGGEVLPPSGSDHRAIRVRLRLT